MCDKVCSTFDSVWVVLDHSNLNTGLTISDLWHRNSDLEWLKEKVTPLHGPKQIIEVFLSSCYAFKTTEDTELARYMNARPSYNCSIPSFGRAVPLELNVQNVTPAQGTEDHHIMYVYDSATGGPKPTPIICCTIPADSLPSLEDIEKWVIENMISYPLHASLGLLRASVFHFAYNYCESGKDLPLVSKNFLADTAKLCQMFVYPSIIFD